ncbi:hypothetical protein T484DRAFT_1762493, partial [Baffinella frigidus]
MGCGQSKVAGAVAPEGEATAARQKEGAEAVARQRAGEGARAQKKAEEEEKDAVSAAGSEGGDLPAVNTAAEAWARPSAIVVEGKAASGTDGSGGGSSAALPPGKHAPASVHLPAHRPTLPPVELRGGKLGASTGMVRTAEAQLERSLEDITGPMDPQQVLRALYTEHCEGPEALEQFESIYGFETCAKEEFEWVVGEEGVDKKTWTLVEGATPKVASKTGVRVRDARTLSEVLKSAEVKLGGLLPEEVIALRLVTGGMHEVYNSIMRGGGVAAEDGKGSRFATT